MKKIFLTLAIICFTGIAFADYDFSKAVQNSSMPTDAEIRAIISKFNFDEDQKEVIFKETKMRLQEIYSGKMPEQYNEELNQNMKYMDSIDDSIMSKSLKEQARRDVSKFPSTQPSSR